MTNKLLSIKETVEPIIGGYWGNTVENGTGNARVVRNGDILESGEIGLKVPERKLNSKEIAKSQLRIGDILITMSGNVGRVARVRNTQDITGRPYVASNFVKILRTKEDIMPEYLFFFLRGTQFHNELKKHTRGVAIQNLSTKIFDQKFIPEIPKDEQKRIVTLLDEAEEIKRKRIEADKKMTIVIPALFNKLFGDPDRNEKKWNTEELGNVCETIYRYPTFYGFKYQNSGVPVVRIGNILQNGIVDPDRSNYVLVSEEVNKRFPKTILELFDILMAVRGDGSTGKRIGLVTAESLIGVNISPNLLRFKTDVKILNPLYLFYLMTSDGGQSLIGRRITRTAKKTITATDIVAIPIPVPPITLQNEFAERVREILHLEEKQKKSSASISDLFSSLLSQAFSSR